MAVDGHPLKSPQQSIRVSPVHHVLLLRISPTAYPTFSSNERDQPLALAEDLALLRSSGLRHVSAFWLEYRELVSGGQK
jgi:hypothetical protein